MEKEETLQEIEPILAVGLGGAAILIAGQLLAMLIQSLTFISAAKEKSDKVLTKKINEILGKSKWKVLLIKDKSPNAFVIGPRVIMITTGLKKMLTDRELTAVMLHEAWHVKSFHVYKKLLYKYPVLAATLMASFAVMASTGIPHLALLVFFILKRVASIPYDLTVGRRQETKSDSYAIKMGYGKELASALAKLEKLYLKEMKNCVGACKIISNLSEALDEHPSLKKRVERILKKTEIAKALAAGKVSQVRKIVSQGFKK